MGEKRRSDEFGEPGEITDRVERRLLEHGDQTCHNWVDCLSRLAACIFVDKLSE